MRMQCPDACAAACAGQAMHDFVAKCLNKDPTGRLSASELLRHPFLAHAKDERYLAHHLLGPSPAALKSARTILSRMPGGDTALVRRRSPTSGSSFFMAQATPESILSTHTAYSRVWWASAQAGCKVLVLLGHAGAQNADGAAGGRRCAAQDIVEGQGCCQEGVHSVPGGVDGLCAWAQVLHRLPYGTSSSTNPCALLQTGLRSLSAISTVVHMQQCMLKTKWQ